MALIENTPSAKSRRINTRALKLAAPAGLLLLWLGMLTGGAGPVDRALLGFLYSAHEPPLRQVALIVTAIGNAQVQLPLLLAGALWLALRRHARSALLLLTTVLLGRWLVELQKWGIGRLRPEEQEHLVVVKSLSFPSAHAANSMMLFLCFALLIAPTRYRGVAVTVALVATFAVGLTRPMLGVHWPSDVVGGWAFGALWVISMLWLANRAGAPARTEGRVQ